MEEKPRKKARPVLGIAIALIVIIVVIGGVYYSSWRNEQSLEKIRNTSEDIRETEQLTMRYRELVLQETLTLDESKELKRITKILDKRYKEVGMEDSWEEMKRKINLERY